MLRLSKKNACNLLGLRAPIEDADLKLLCRQTLERYCPTPGVVRDLMTQLLAEAYRVLKSSPQDLKPAQDPGYSERLSRALYVLSDQQLPFELCGGLLWVFDRSGSLEEVLQSLGFQLAFSKGAWVLRPASAAQDAANLVATDTPSDLERIQTIYGSQKIV